MVITLDRFARQMAGVIQRHGVGRVYVARGTDAVSTVGGRLTTWPFDRLMVVAGGRRRVRFCCDASVAEVTLLPGDVLLIPANAWLVSFYTRRFSNLTYHAAEDGAQLLSARYRPRHGAYPQSYRPTPFISLSTGPDHELRTYLQLMHQHATTPDAAEYLTRLAELALLKIRDSADDPPAQPSGKARQTFKAALQFVASNCDVPLTREDVAEALHVHPNHVSRLFKRYAGQGFNQVLNDLRMQRARRLLSDKTLSIKQVAFQCGFDDANYFSRAFRRHFGEPPSRARVALLRAAG